jgi:hypothetical protein
VEACLAMGDLAGSAKWLDWLDQFPVGHLADIEILERDRLRARLLAANGEPDAGIAFDGAVTGFRAWFSPYHLAVALLDRAEYQVGAGDLERAVEAAAEAGEIGRRLSCQPVVSRAEAIAPPVRIPDQPVLVAVDTS